MLKRLLGDLDINYHPIIMSNHGMFMNIKLESSYIDPTFLLAFNPSHGKAPPKDGEDKFDFQDKQRKTQLLVVLKDDRRELKEMHVFVTADGITSEPVAEDLRHALSEIGDTNYYGDLFYHKDNFNESLINMLRFAVKKLQMPDLKLKTMYEMPKGYAEFLSKELGVKVEIVNESPY